MFIKNKKYTEKILDFNTIEDFFVLKTNYKQCQQVSYNCKQCNKISVRTIERIYSLQNKNKFNWLCRNCQSIQTCLKKYGVKRPSISENIKEKAKQTCLKKYGVPYTSQIKESREKASETWRNRNKERKIEKQYKMKQTCLKKYGTVAPAQNQKIKDKIKQTWIDRYGSLENFFKERNVKYLQTINFKYQGAWPSSLTEIKEKNKQTCLRRYGVTNPSQYKFFEDKKRKKYMYEKQSFDSSWELAVWVWAKDNGKNIKKNPLILRYMFEKKEHTYFPDFQIENKLIEVKGPQFFKEDGTMCNPYDHSLDSLFEAKHQCGLSNGVEFWGEKEMKPILKYIEEKYGKNFLQFHRK